MPPTTPEQVRALARAFLDLSHALATYRFDRWDALGPERRRSIEDLEWSLANFSSDLTTHAVGTALDDVEGDVKAIQGATEKAKAIMADLQGVERVLTIAARAMAVGAAVLTGNASAVAGAMGGLAEAVGKVAQA